MKHKKFYRVVFEHDAGGWWVASVPAIAGCHTQGRTIEQARERIREAIQVCLDLPQPYGGALEDDVRLPAHVQKAVRAASEARAKADELERAVLLESKRAIERLKKIGVSLSDAGHLLGISRQRAQQISKAS